MGLETGIFDKEQQVADIANQIAIALQGIRFGSVEIIIHESKVVQIERREKLRFDRRSTLEKSSF
ncbi:MAG: YezD family protein [Methyloglobulus sp.]|nr:YezD family protein [Methyloglobulus sp.]